jgi:dihydroorotase
MKSACYEFRESQSTLKKEVQLYDLLIKGGRVIDPAQGIDDKLDIGINGDKIAVLTKDIPPQQSHKVVDATGKIVTPGLIDMHCHVYAGVHKDSLDPDAAGIMQGVTTVVDAGSSGQAIFGGFSKYVIPSSRTNVICFLSLASHGQTLMPELRDWAEIDMDATIATIQSNRNTIKGLKLRLVGNLVANDGVKVWEAIKNVAKKVGLPVMVHPTDRWKKTPLGLTQEILALMEPGDILTHVYSPMHGGCLYPDGTFYPELKDAMKRGVILDVGHGGAQFNYNIASRGIAEGILPTTISTDLVNKRLDNCVFGLTVVMSKFLALGLDLMSIVRMTTMNPAHVLNVDKRIGSLKLGMDADISVVEIKSGLWELEELEGQSIKITDLLTPCFTIKSGQFIEAKPTARPKSLR